MYRSPKLVALVLITFLLSGCSPFLNAGRPRLGPVQGKGRVPNGGSITLAANTNCAVVGEVVTFTLTIANAETHPVTFTGDPLFDIVLSHGNQRDVRRWSDTAQYPPNINPVFAPGEERTYTWQWTADAIYVPDRLTSGVIAQVTTKVISPRGSDHNNRAVVALGVDYLQENGGHWPCSELRR